MDDLISREALKKAIAAARTNYNTCPDYNELFNYFCDVVSAIIDEIPAAKRKRKGCELCGRIKAFTVLTDCGLQYGPSIMAKFCPNCGAKMEDKDNE